MAEITFQTDLESASALCRKLFFDGAYLNGAWPLINCGGAFRRVPWHTPCRFW